MSDSNRVSASLAQRVATATKLMFYTHILNDNPNGLLRALWHAFSNDRAGRRDRTRTFGATVRRTNLYTIGLYNGLIAGGPTDAGPPSCNIVSYFFLIFCQLTPQISQVIHTCWPVYRQQ